MEGAIIQSLTIVALAAVTAIGTLIVRELRILHNRIKERDRRWDRHLEESKELHEKVTRIETKQDLHMENGHYHKN